MPKPNGRLLLAMVLSGAMGLAQTAGDQPASVAGTVTNAAGGGPILRAHVVLQPVKGGQQTYGALTGAEGKFSIAQVPPGQYRISVDKLGFRAANPELRARMAELAAGDKKEDLKLTLVPNGSIAGRVLDANGDPVEGAQLSIPPAAAGTTDEQGQFRLGDLRPGRYRVLASQASMPYPPEKRTDGTAEAHYGPTYYPGSLSAKSAGRVAVTAGVETSGIEIRLVPTPIVRVSGVVTGLPRGVQNAMVRLQRRSGSSGGTFGLVRPDGSFEAWRIDPGSYRLAATWRGSSGQMLQTAPLEIEVADSNIDNLELRVVAPSDISGTVQYDDDGARPPQPQPDSSLPPPGQQAPQRRAQPPMLFLWDAFGNQYGRSLQAEVKPDGSFALQQVPAGRYSVAPSWGPAYVKSMQLGTTQMEGRILDLTNGSAGSPLTVVVSSAVGEVSGAVRMGDDPAPGAQVMLMPVPADGERVVSTVSGADGTYRFAGLAPGKYKLVALDKDDPGAGNYRQDPDDIDNAIDISISPGDKLTQDLTVKRE